MREAAGWRPSKFVPDPRSGRWRPNPDYVKPSSWFACEVLIGPYAEAIRANARGRLLDAGCGDVPYYGLYRDIVTEVSCVDWPGSSHGGRHVDQEMDLNAPLPLAESAFDTVLLADVLEHIARPAELLAELRRVLAPGGRLLVMVPFLYYIHEAPHDYYRYTAHALQRLCAEAGLAVEQLAPYGGLPDVLLDLGGKAFIRGRGLGRLYTGLALPLQRAGWYRRWRARTAEAFPLGYVLVARRPE